MYGSLARVFKPMAYLGSFGGSFETNYFYREDLGISNYDRSGSNNNSTPYIKKAPVKVPYKRLVRVKGVRPSFVLVWSHKKSDWVSVPRELYAERVVFTKAKKLKKPHDLLPNSLSFRSTKVVSSEGLRRVDANRTPMIDGWTNNASISSGEPLANAYRLPVINQGVGYLSARGVDISAVLTDLIPNLRESANSKLFKKAKNQYSNLGNVMIEANRTRKMIGEIVVNTAKILVDLKSLRLASAAKRVFGTSAKLVGAKHLTVVYGIVPALDDLDGLLEHAATPETLEFDIKVRSFRGLDEKRESIFESQPDAILGYRDEIFVSGRVDVVRKVRVRVQGGRELTRNLSRLGLTNFDALAWEAIPFSFIADWFIPIGNYLNTQDAFAGLDIVWSTETVFIRQKRRLLRTFGAVPSQWLTTSGTVQEVVETVSCVRTIDNSPRPTLPFPDFKNPLSKVHATNLASLIAVLKGK